VTRTRFITTHTRLRATPFVPEVLLHLADEAIGLWEHTEKETGAEQAPPFWAFPWAGGQALARYVLDRPETVAGRRVLDLAAGSGLVAVAAALAGAASVTANEIDEYAVAAIGLNSTANGVRVTALLGDLLAEAPAADVVVAADVVLAGDIFYSRAMSERMLPFLARAHAGGALVLVGDPGRAYAPRSGFTALAHYDVPVVRALEDADRKPTTILTPKDPRDLGLRLGAGVPRTQSPRSRADLEGKGSG
jgi:predicted nicotinamide N-methyase